MCFLPRLFLIFTQQGLVVPLFCSREFRCLCGMPVGGVLFIKFFRTRLNLACARRALISSSGLNRVYISGAHARPANVAVH